MSQTLSVPLDAPRPERRSSSLPIPVIVTIAVLAIAHVPLLLAHLHVLSLKPHYEFYPLVFVGAGVLAWPIRRLLAAGHRANPTEWKIGLGLLALNWLMLTTAVVLDSPWLGMVSFWELLAAVALLAGGRVTLRAAVPALIFLVLVIPPPMNLDTKLVTSLQTVTSKISSKILNRMGVLHFLDGNTVEIGTKSYFVDKACSGINSLFSTIAVTLFCVLYFGSSWLRTICLFLAVVFWVVAANVTRVTSIVWLDRRFGIDLSKEQWDWAKGQTLLDINLDRFVPGPHALFGFLLFAMVLGLMYSTNRFLMFLGTTIRWGDQAPLSEDDPVPPTDAPPPHTVSWVTAMPCLALYGVLVLFQAGEVKLGAVGTESEMVKFFNGWDKEYLPPVIGAGWKQQGDSNFEKRDRDNPFGAHSRTWQYHHPSGMHATISFDYPFPEWHDLRMCYTSVGWIMDDSKKYDVTTAPDVKLECVKFELSKPFEQRGYGWFTEFDQTGRPIPVVVPDLTRSYTSLRWDDRFKNIHDRWLSLFGRATAPPNFMDVLQVQVFTNNFGQYTPEQKDLTEKFFNEAVEMIRRRVVAGPQGGPAS
jgi:exosortase